MIFNIRGTSGSGKSHLVRSIMQYYDRREKYHLSGRKQPIGYVLHRDMDGKTLAVVGHYETPCGGCDTIPKMEKIFELVRQSHDAGHDVIFEGLLISADMKRIQALHDDDYPIMVMALDTPIEDCLAGVNERRKTRMKEKYTPVNPKNTGSKHKGVISSTTKLQKAGVQAAWFNRASAREFLVKELRLET